jgi:hypothetical protein
MYVSQERFSITRTRTRPVVVLHLIKKINGNESPAWRSQSPDGNRAQPVVHADFQHISRNSLCSDELVVSEEHKGRVEREETLY